MSNKVYTSDELKQFYLGSKKSTQEKELVLNSTPKHGLTPTVKTLLGEAMPRINSLKEEILDEVEKAEYIQTLVEELSKKEDIVLSSSEKKLLTSALTTALKDFGILTPLVEDPRVNDIIVSAYNDISVQTSRSNIQTDLAFPNRRSYETFVENILKKADKECTLAKPVVDIALNSSIRLCVTHKSFSPAGQGPMMCIRVARHENIDIEKLAELKLAPLHILEYLSTIVRHSLGTIILAGEVGTGKTTLARSLASSIKEDEAILVIEDTNEIDLKRRFVRTLLTREGNSEGSGLITPAQAIRTGMRLAMNRIILGEIRDAAAAEAFIDVCGSGHPGISTIHAKSAKDALNRLELFLSRIQIGVDTSFLKRQLANSIDLVVHIGIDPKSKLRRIKEVVEVQGATDGNIQFSPIFKFDNSSNGPSWVRGSGLSIIEQFNNTPGNTPFHLPYPGTIIRE